MRTIGTVTALALAFAGTTATANVTQENAEKTSAVIDAAIEAHGGAERLGAIETVVVEADTRAWLVNQSKGTEAPWDQTVAKLYNAVDLKNERFVSSRGVTRIIGPEVVSKSGDASAAGPPADGPAQHVALARHRRHRRPDPRRGVTGDEGRPRAEPLLRPGNPHAHAQ